MFRYNAGCAKDALVSYADSVYLHVQWKASRNRDYEPVFCVVMCDFSMNNFMSELCILLTVTFVFVYFIYSGCFVHAFFSASLNKVAHFGQRCLDYIVILTCNCGVVLCSCL